MFDPPPQGDFNRSMIEERLREAMDANGEKVSIELGGERKHLYVISMPIERLYYNPGTRRIRAQRALDPKRDRQLDEAPWSDEGQAYLEKLLKSDQVSLDKVDPDFEALCENLENFGQKDPGIITRSGILVNGNTRCAALNVLGEKYIRVGVLPESTNWDDIHTIELALQLRKEHKREYSYINRLLAIEEQAKLGRRPADIARDFQIKTATLEADRWVYSVLMDVIDRSKTESGAS
ncbi:MAG: hypothetical protein M0026_21835, partial [Nocardiopsaceae bacterium]|nr:hypothetical protein [Nocardiopsaceae bacterium]